MARYRKRPVVIEAAQYDGNDGELSEFMGAPLTLHAVHGTPVIHTLEGDLLVSHGDFVIRDVNGEFYPCKPDIFEATYEAI